MRDRLDPAIGLCSTCRHAREIVSGKGSKFWLCEVSQVDERYRRYPQLPVSACAAHEPHDPLRAPAPCAADKSGR